MVIFVGGRPPTRSLIPATPGTMAGGSGKRETLYNESVVLTIMQCLNPLIYFVCMPG